jgi:hypothetical protein
MTPFAFTVGLPFRWYATTVESKIADLWEALDATDFQDDSHRQNATDTGYCQQLFDPFIELDALYDRLL